MFDGVAASDLFKIQKVIAEGQWREDHRSPDWAGNAVANVIGIEANLPAERKRIASMLKVWIGNKVLKIVEKPDAKRMTRRLSKFEFGK
jgi:hypothetical protein